MEVIDNLQTLVCPEWSVPSSQYLSLQRRRGEHLGLIVDVVSVEDTEGYVPRIRL
jgi:hypothetical protein